MYPYLTYSDFLARRFDGKVQKIGVDAGFTCPNRDGTCGTGGCTFCDNRSFVPSYCRAGDGVGEQLRRGVAFFARKYPQMRFLAYFQAYSNTYAQPDVLRARYEEALAVEGVVGLVVATRPDCLPPDVVDLLAEFARRTFVQVEVGVETVHDRTLRLVNRGHDFACAVDAIRRLAGRGIAVGAHMILGLPGESPADMLDQARALAPLPIDTLKLHQLQVLRGTPMAALLAGRPELFHTFAPEEYAGLVLDYIDLLPQTVAFDRFVNVSPPALLARPGWGLKNHEFLAVLRNVAARRIHLMLQWTL